MKRFVMNNVVSTTEMTAAEYKSKFGNAMYSVNVAGEVLIKDCSFGQNGYNCIEIGLDTKVEPPTKVTIENCDFAGELTNNAITIFGTQDNAVITIKNCHFANVSNAVRLSNRTNAKNITVNLVDCTCDKWEADSKYAGFLLLQDYTNKTVDDFREANLFGKSKITINISNLVHNGKRVVFGDPESFINCNSASQIIYLWVGGVPADYRYPEYEPEIFPTINIK